MPATVFMLSGDPDSMRIYAGLKNLDLDPFNASYVLDLSWNKDAKELSLNEYSFAEASLGSYSLKGTIGNFTEAMFTFDKTVLGLSALGLTAKDASLQVENKGGFDRFLKVAALEEGVTAEQVRARMPDALALIPEPFASLPSIQTIKKAVLAFWENPGKLSIMLKAKNGTGVGVADFAVARNDPKSLDGKLDVTAMATK